MKEHRPKTTSVSLHQYFLQRQPYSGFCFKALACSKVEKKQNRDFRGFSSKDQ